MLVRVTWFPDLFSVVAILTGFYVERNSAHGDTPMALDYSLAVGMCEQYQEYLATHKVQPPLKHKSEYAASRRCGWMHKQSCGSERYCRPYVFKPCEGHDSVGGKKQGSPNLAIKLHTTAIGNRQVNRGLQRPSSDSNEPVSESERSALYFPSFPSHGSHELQEHSRENNKPALTMSDMDKARHDQVNVTTNKVRYGIKTAQRIKDVSPEIGAYDNTIRDTSSDSDYSTIYGYRGRENSDVPLAKTLHYHTQVPKDHAIKTDRVKIVSDPVHRMEHHVNSETASVDHFSKIIENSMTSDSSESPEHDSEAALTSRPYVAPTPYMKIPKNHSSEEISTTIPTTSRATTQQETQTSAPSEHKEITYYPQTKNSSSQKENQKDWNLFTGKSPSSKLHCCSCECGSSASFEDGSTTPQAKDAFGSSTSRPMEKSEQLKKSEKAYSKCASLRRKTDISKKAKRHEETAKLNLQNLHKNSTIPVSTTEELTRIPHITFNSKKSSMSHKTEAKQSPKILMYISESLSQAICQQFKLFHETGKVQRELDDPSKFGVDSEQDSKSCVWYQRNICGLNQKNCELWKKTTCNEETASQ